MFQKIWFMARSIPRLSRTITQDRVSLVYAVALIPPLMARRRHRVAVGLEVIWYTQTQKDLSLRFYEHALKQPTSISHRDLKRLLPKQTNSRRRHTRSKTILINVLTSRNNNATDVKMDIRTPECIVYSETSWRRMVPLSLTSGLDGGDIWRMGHKIPSVSFSLIKNFHH